MEQSFSPEPHQHSSRADVSSRSRMKSVESDDDSSSSATAKTKIVAIDTSQNEHFTHRLLPVQSPEFDNVIDQVCMHVSAHVGAVTHCLCVQALVFVAEWSQDSP